MQSLLVRCRTCASPIDATRKAALLPRRNVLLDLACDGCGKRALYPLGESPLA